MIETFITRYIFISVCILGDEVRQGEMLKLPTRLMTTTKKMVRVMIVAVHQHSNAQAKKKTCILSGDQLLLWENHLFKTQGGLEPPKWLACSFCSITITIAAHIPKKHLR
jgi:hypothetical protein